MTYFRRRIRLHKTEGYNAGVPFGFRFTLPAADPEVRCLNRELSPIIRRVEPAGVNNTSTWQLDLNLAHAPMDEPLDVNIEALFARETKQHMASEGSVDITTDVPVTILDAWILCPETKPFVGYRLIEFKESDPTKGKLMHPDDGLESSTGTLIRWTLLNTDRSAIYRCRWTWKD